MYPNQQFDPTGYSQYNYEPVLKKKYKIGNFEIGEDPYKQLQLMATLGQAGLIGESDFANALMSAISGSQADPYAQMGGQMGGQMPMGMMGGMPSTPQGLDVTDEEYQSYLDAQKTANKGLLGTVGDIAMSPVTPIGQLKWAGTGFLGSAKDLYNNPMRGNVQSAISSKLGRPAEEYFNIFNSFGDKFLK